MQNKDLYLACQVIRFGMSLVDLIVHILYALEYCIHLLWTGLHTDLFSDGEGAKFGAWKKELGGGGGRSGGEMREEDELFSAWSAEVFTLR